MISVILPTYNRSKLVGRAINNILKQSYENFELIIVDDNSSDDTESVVKKFEDKRIRYVKNDINRGACFSRNLGIKLSRGEYIAFQDSDDLWDEDKLKKQIEFIEESKFDFVFCKIKKINSKGVITSIVPNDFICNMKIDSHLLLCGNLISTQTILSKRKCFDKILFDENLPRYQDWDLVIRISKNYNIGFQNDVLAEQYIQTDSITNNYHKSVIALKQLYEKYYQFVSDKMCLYYFWDLYGLSLYVTNSNEAKKAYKKAFLYNKCTKSFIKYLLSDSCLLKYFLKVRQ